MLVVKADSPAKTVKELIAMLASKPGGYAYPGSWATAPPSSTWPVK